MTERLPRCEPMPKAVPCNTTLADYKQILNINNMTSQQSYNEDISSSTYSTCHCQMYCQGLGMSFSCSMCYGMLQTLQVDYYYTLHVMY